MKLKKSQRNKTTDSGSNRKDIKRNLETKKESYKL